MDNIQLGILRPLPVQACYLTFELKPKADTQTILHCLETIDIKNNVTGIGASLLKFIACNITNMSVMPDLTSGDINIPSTPTALWCWLQDDDQGKLLHRARQLKNQLSPAFNLASTLDAYQHDQGKDLTGYEDGTENPEGENAKRAAILSDSNPALDGSSFVAVQLWQHNFDTFESFTSQHQDHIIGRRLRDNEELDDAPESAHVKRTAQESYSPEAFMLRRSMPWSKDLKGGLQFVAFGCSFYAFEAQMKRMTGTEDGVIDGLFQFSQPHSGAYYWCPPTKDNQLNIDALRSQLK
jgi:putative iron-dependent peroxidase